MAKQFDFVAIGDIVTDAFIRLQVAEEHVKGDKEELCMPFATKIPYEFVVEIPAVGNCANAAVAAARLGLSSALISNQGDDEVGKKHLTRMTEEKVSTDYIISHPGKKSNYHYVLWFKDDRTILVKHEDYPYSLPEDLHTKWLYLTSLSSTSGPFHDTIADYLDNHPETNLVFQPGTFQIKLGKDRLARLYKRSNIFFCNVQEAREILSNDEQDIKKLLEAVHELGPKVVVITDGPNGAYARGEDGTMLFMPLYPDIAPPYDRTGAGDAFASTFAIALAKGKTLEEALMWAPINSMSVVQKVGAQEGLVNEAQMADYLAKAPADYKPRPL
jgi:ribokinase